jgi:hypothetical protein
LDLFRRFLGEDAQIGRISREDAKRFRAALLRFPSRVPATVQKWDFAATERWAVESAPQAQERKVRDELTDRAQAA